LPSQLCPGKSAISSRNSVFKLFDRVGRRLLLTGEGEQLLSDCRGLLNYASALGERARLLRHGDTGVLKVAASPQHIESILSSFLHRYAERYPHVQVKLIEETGLEILAMLARAERSRSAGSRLIRCFCWMPGSLFAEHSTPPAASQGLSQTLCSKAGPRTPCSRWLKPGTGWRSFRHSYELIVMCCELSV
jgi:DNA-binding transcriptional LysR family regulator